MAYSSPRALQGVTAPGGPGSTEKPLDTVLRSEIEQYCQLTDHIRQSLDHLQLALSGTVEMSASLQQLAHDVSRKEVRGSLLLPPKTIVVHENSTNWEVQKGRKFHKYTDSLQA